MVSYENKREKHPKNSDKNQKISGRILQIRKLSIVAGITLTTVDSSKLIAA